MRIIWYFLTAAIAIEHLYILWIEMFAWETLGKRAFGRSLKPELFAPTKKLAANQGLYNGFLAAGLLWSLFIADPYWQKAVATFFLGCVLVAGIYGGLTAGRRIIYVQAIPAALGLLVTWLLQ